MKYEVQQVEAEQGTDRVFIRVAAWYDAHADRAKNAPDLVADFLLRTPGPVPTYVEDGLGQRRTVSGRWHPGVVEEEGRWVPVPVDGPEGDPWEVVMATPDPLDALLPTIEGVLEMRRRSGHRGLDIFQPQDAPKVDKAHRVSTRHDLVRLRSVRGKPRTPALAKPARRPA